MLRTEKESLRQDKIRKLVKAKKQSKLFLSSWVHILYSKEQKHLKFY